MPNFGAGDVPALLSQLGVAVTIGSVTAQALVERADRRLLESDTGVTAVRGRGVVLTLQPSTFPALAEGVAITVDGVSYKAASILLIEDGELAEVTCTTL